MGIDVVELTMYLGLGFVLTLLLVWGADRLLTLLGDPPSRWTPLFQVTVIMWPLVAALLWWLVELIRTKPS